MHIEPEGKYRLTPLYDIISAYPLVVNRQLQAKKIKMAMALKSKSNHYHWFDLQRRHFLSMANNTNYSSERAEQLIDEIIEKVDFVIQKVGDKLPQKFPSRIYDPIFTGMQSVKRKLKGRYTFI